MSGSPPYWFNWIIWLIILIIIIAVVFAILDRFAYFSIILSETSYQNLIGYEEPFKIGSV